ncbi:MAG: hypothetical protein NZ765_05935 [Anaerolineae bacterium]|nr:hypothetical protein [Anaerolineae bacterium]MDW8071138.1 hypothetical protein [Anaerolineae bacterium]
MPPELLLIVLFGVSYGALFHLYCGRKLRQLLAFLLASIVGFAFGQLIGELAGLAVFTMGRLHPVEGSLGSGIFLFIARWLKL